MYVGDKLQHLGNSEDDHGNFFTARMLLLLESYCVYGDKSYSAIIDTIIERYFADYPKHKEEFFPTFLINDICRYWKTLLLNYESKRSLPKTTDSEYELIKAKHSIKNFKLKFSRMTTCFATICAIASLNVDFTPEKIANLVKLTPRKRLFEVSKNIPELSEDINQIFNDYAWFFGLTDLSTDELNTRFMDKENKINYFDKAIQYRGKMVNLLKRVDVNNDQIDLFNLLVI